MDYTTPTIKMFNADGEIVVINSGDKESLDNWNKAGYKTQDQIEAEDNKEDK